ncbi:MAG: NapC/NirT family cytochrome c [Planctomycetota bacterium]
MIKGVSRIIRWGFRAFKRWGTPFFLGIAVSIICFLSLNAVMEPFSKNTYCGTACHEMNTAYQTWELSHHAANADGIRVDCIQCHLPPKEDYFTHLAAKSRAGAKDMYMHHFGPEYDVETIRQEVLERVSNETCTHCHDDLLIKPSDAKAREAHLAAQQEPDKPENKCTACHEDAGHKRNTKLYSP